MDVSKLKTTCNNNTNRYTHTHSVRPPDERSARRTGVYLRNTQKAQQTDISIYLYFFVLIILSLPFVLYSTTQTSMPGRDSNPQPQQAIGRTPSPLGSALTRQHSIKLEISEGRIDRIPHNQRIENDNKETGI